MGGFLYIQSVCYYTLNYHNLTMPKRGSGLINSVINKLPIELHLPGYQYCGPGTKLEKRLKRGDMGINPLDAACKQHDIAYSQHKNIQERHKADKVLTEKAWQRFKSKDAKFGEKASALLITNAMKAKTTLGMGGKHTFSKGIKNIRNFVQKHGKSKDVKSKVKLALKFAKKEMKLIGKTPRIIPIPKTGGILPFIIPLLAGLSAVGSLAGGTASIVKTVNEFKDAKKRLKETERHNNVMEAVMLKKGSGLFLKPYKTGYGLFLKPYKSLTKN